MNKRSGWIVLAGLAVFASAAFAGLPDPATRGWCRGSAYDKTYDCNREVITPGTVVKVENFTPQPGMAEGRRALVAIGSESVWVHLGPVLFLEAQDMKLAAGDHVVITGANLRVNGERVVMAAEVEKDGRVLRLRDHMGRPAWNAWRSRLPA